MKRLPTIFTLGDLYTTPGAHDVAAAVGLDLMALVVMRHARGDYGDLDSEDIAANTAAIADGERILSVYTAQGARFYVLTEADRSRTTVLLAEEY